METDGSKSNKPYRSTFFQFIVRGDAYYINLALVIQKGGTFNKDIESGDDVMGRAVQMPEIKWEQDRSRRVIIRTRTGNHET